MSNIIELNSKRIDTELKKINDLISNEKIKYFNILLNDLTFNEATKYTRIDTPEEVAIIKNVERLEKLRNDLIKRKIV